MKMLNFILIFILLSSFSYSKENSLYIGITESKIFGSKKEGRIASKIWTKYTAQKGYENVFVKAYEYEDDLLLDFLSYKVKSMVSTYEMYYRNKRQIDMFAKRRWVPSITKGMFEQYYLIKNIESSITMNDLSNKIVNYKKDIAKLWFEYLVLNKYKKPMLKVISNIEEIKKPKKLIYNVFFNKDEISIVSKKTYDDMVELNPQIKNQIEIIRKSKPIFLSGIGFTSRKIDPYYVDMISNLKKDIDNEGLLKLTSAISIYKIYDIKEEELKPLNDFFSEYLRLKELYK